MLLGFLHICFKAGDREERWVKIAPGTSIFQQLPCLIPNQRIKTHVKEYTQNAGCRQWNGWGRGRKSPRMSRTHAAGAGSADLPTRAVARRSRLFSVRRKQSGGEAGLDQRPPAL